MGKSCSSWAFCLAASTLILAKSASASFWTAGPYFARWALTASARRLEKGRRLGEGLDQLEAERFVGRLLEGGQQAVDFDRSGGAQCLGQLGELLGGELRPCQDVGRGGAGRRPSVAASLPSRNAKRLSSGLVKAARHGGQRTQAKLVGILGIGGDPEQAGGKLAGLALVSGKARAAATASGTSSAFDAVARRARSPGPMIQLGRHLFFIQPRPGHGLQAALPRGARGGGVSQAGGQELLDRRGLCQAAQLLFQLGSLGGGRSVRSSRSPRTPASRAGPFAVPAHDPRRRLLERRVGRGEQAGDERGSSRPPSIWSSATIAARSVRGFLLFRPAAVASGSAISIRA